MVFPRTWWRVLLAGCVLAGAWTMPARGDLQEDTESLVQGADDRAAGSVQAADNADWLLREVAQRTGAMPQRQSFVLTVPVVEQCTAREWATGAGPPGASVPIAPLLPSGGQAAALRGNRLAAELFYGRQGQLEQWRSHPLAGRIMALDASSPPAAWQTAASLGAAAIVFLGDKNTGAPDLLNKSVNIPIGIPRFYCDDPVATERIRSGAITGLDLQVKVTWQEKRVDNVLCLIGSKQNSASRDTSWTNSMLVLQARYDGASEVMTRAPGATQALNASLLLDLAQRIAATPAHRPVLVAFTAGDQWNLAGSRALLDLLNREMKDPARTLTILRAQAQSAADRLRSAEGVFKNLPRLMTGDITPLRDEPTATAVENQLLRTGSGVEESLQQARLENAASQALTLEARKSNILDATSLLRDPGSTPAGTAAQEELGKAAETLLPVYREEVAHLTKLHDTLSPWPEICSTIGARTPMLWLSLALTSGSDKYGFFPRSYFFREFDASGPMSTFAQSFRRYQPVGDTAFQTDSLENRFTLETFFSVPVAFSSDAALARGLPAGALATTSDSALAIDTPTDTPAHLQWNNVDAQVRSIQRLLLGSGGAPGLVTDPLFYGRADLPAVTANQNVTLFERTLGESLPRVPAMHTLIGGETLSNGQPLGPPLAGMRRKEWHLTDAEGSATFTAALRTPTTRTRLQALTFDADGIPVSALAANQADVHGLAADFSPDPDRPLRAMLFRATRLDAYGLFDPRSLETLDTLDILDARRLDKAEFSAILPAPAPASFATLFFPPHIHWQLLAGRGNVGNRMLLINADARHPLGEGFDTTDLATLGSLPLRNARDLSLLNARRERDLERFGVSNEVVKTLQAASVDVRRAAAAAEKTQDYPAQFAATDALWALQSQVYQQLIDTSNGIIKAVIFLLLALIPFSYFLERLLIGAASITRQIAGFGTIFLLMTAALAFHPAFRISSAPLMILLAFLILILSSTVVYILWGKFEEEIARLQGAGAAAHSISLRRGAVFGAAIRLGLSNMRRRGMRTALTLITLILLTFTLLCFTSVRDVVQVSPQLLPTAPAPPGILLRQRGWRTLPPDSLQLAQSLAPTIAGRWWYVSEKAEQPWALPVNASEGPPFFAGALLGLEENEAIFQSPSVAPLLPHGDTCILPAKAAELLQVRAGDTVTILGHPLTVARVATAPELAALRQLTADPLMPIDPAGQTNTPTVAPTADAATSAAAETSYRFMSPDNVILVPSSLVRQLGGRLTSIMLLPAAHEPAAINAFAAALAQRSTLSIVVSDGLSTRTINASAGAAPQNFGDVLVPLLIAGVIVLNTMLGAVAERTREIHVYTSVGLAPAHVGMLFLAEAAALGTIGTVAGYIFGQGFATFLSWSHLLPGIALNYSSLSAIATMGIVLGIVLLSALWPARAASRVAAPSLRKDWKLPRPVGDLLSVDLPFTVNDVAARGVCAFIAEYLLAAGQSGAGRFTADTILPFTEPTTQGPVRGLTARVWLTPYDLGVIETLRLAIHPTDSPHVFDVHLDLTREAGNPATWNRLNRSFLTDVRKQFLLWRNLPPAQTETYLARAQTMFAATP